MPAPNKNDLEAKAYEDFITGNAAGLPYAIGGGGRHSALDVIRKLNKPNALQGDRWEQPAGNGFDTKVNVGGGFRKFTNDVANKECENVGIGDFPMDGDLRCYMCGIYYSDPRSRKRDGGECEHVLPFWLLYLLIGIKHTSYIKWRDRFFSKFGILLAGEGITSRAFIAYQEWLWGGAYRWSCWPCNRLKSNCGYIDIGMDPITYRLRVAGGAGTSPYNTVASLTDDPPASCYTGNINDHYLILMLGNSGYARTWRKMYNGQIEGPRKVIGKGLATTSDPNTFLLEDKMKVTFSDVKKAGVGGVKGGDCERLFKFLIKKFKQNTSELIKKLAILNMPVAQRSSITPEGWTAVPDSLGPKISQPPHSTLTSQVHMGIGPKPANKELDIEPEQFFSTVTLIARAIILEKTQLTSFAGHFASIITNSFTSLGDDTSGAALGGLLGGGRKYENLKNKNVNQKGGEIIFPQEPLEIMQPGAIDWTRDFAKIQISHANEHGLVSKVNTVDIDKNWVYDRGGQRGAEAQNLEALTARIFAHVHKQHGGKFIYIGNSNDADNWGMYVYEIHQIVEGPMVEDSGLHTAVLKLSAAVLPEELNAHFQEIWEWHKTRVLEEIGEELPIPEYDELVIAAKSSLTAPTQEEEDAVQGLIELWEGKDLKTRDQVLADYESFVGSLKLRKTEFYHIAFNLVYKAQRAAGRAKLNILLMEKDKELDAAAKKKNQDEIEGQLHLINSDEDLTVFLAAICLYNSRKGDTYSIAILEIINSSGIKLSEQLFRVPWAQFKGTLVAIIEALKVDNLVASTSSINDIVKNVAGQSVQHDPNDEELFKNLDGLTPECFYSATGLIHPLKDIAPLYQTDLKSTAGPAAKLAAAGPADAVYESMGSGKEARAVALQSVRSGIDFTSYFKAVQEEEIVKLNINYTVDVVVQLYKNSCYLEGIYNLLDSVSNEIMAKWLHSAIISLDSSDYDPTLARLILTLVQTGKTRAAVELFLLTKKNVEQFLQIMGAEVKSFARNSKLHLDQIEPSYELPFLSKSLIDDFEPNGGFGEDHPAEKYIIFFNSIYEELGEEMDWERIDQAYPLIVDDIVYLNQFSSKATQLLSILIKRGTDLSALDLRALVKTDIDAEKIINLINLDVHPNTESLGHQVLAYTSLGVSNQTATQLSSVGFLPQRVAELLEHFDGLQVDTLEPLIITLKQQGVMGVEEIVTYFKEVMAATGEAAEETAQLIIISNITGLNFDDIRHNITAAVALARQGDSGPLVQNIEEHEGPPRKRRRGGAPKYPHRSSNKPKKKSIKKKKSKNKYIKKSLKYSKKKSIKNKSLRKKSFKKSGINKKMVKTRKKIRKLKKSQKI